MSAEKKVITIKGEEVLISKCRKFNKLYYKIGDPKIKDSGDCYLISEKYYREETGQIVYNYSINEYVLKNDNLIFGVVDVDNDNINLGYFNNNPFTTKIHTPTTSYVLLNTNVKGNAYRENLSDGEFYHIQLRPSYSFNEIKFPTKDYKYSLPYDSKGIVSYNLQKYNQNYNPATLTNIEKISPLLGDLSFGLEFETTKGFIPDRILYKYGLIPLRDGSISGIEYVTVPMTGQKGLSCVVDVLEELEKRTVYDDDSCSLHLHLGNVPRTEEFILAFFILSMKIQDEMFKLFPIYKKYNFGIKNKNYSSPLPTFEIMSQLDSVIDKNNITKNFNVVYKYLSMGQDFKAVNNSLENVVSHPRDQNGTQKWNISTRYHIFNMIPLLFGNKQTIECRIHTPTYDVNKIIPFILMNSLLVNFTIQNQSQILKKSNFLNQVTLFGILDYQMETFDNSIIKDFRNLLRHYLINRANYCEKQTVSGNILGTESKIKVPNNIDWRKIKPINNPDPVINETHTMFDLNPFVYYNELVAATEYQKPSKSTTISVDSFHNEQDKPITTELIPTEQVELDNIITEWQMI